MPIYQEMKGTPLPDNIVNVFKPLTVAGIQGLAETTDYVISEGNDSITLKLKYQFNKSYDDKVLNYLFGEQDYLTKGVFSENLKNLCVVRYLRKWFKKSIFLKLILCLLQLVGTLIKLRRY